MRRSAGVSLAHFFTAITSCLAAFAVLGVLLNGCGGGGMKSAAALDPGPTASFAFVADSVSGDVAVFSVGVTGILTQMGTPIASGAGAEFLAVDPVHNFLYVTNQNANTISAFSINTMTGALAQVPGSPFATGLTPHGVAVDSLGRFAYVANQNDNSISAFSIDGATGALTPVPGSPFAGIDSPFGLTLHPLNSSLYVTNVNSNTVTQLTLDIVSGAPAVPGTVLAAGQTPIGVAVDPNGQFLYVGDHMQDAISSYSIDPFTAKLTPVSGPAASANTCSNSCHVNPLRVAIDRTSHFAYAADVGGNSVSAFSLSNGMLTAIGSPVPVGQHPFGVAFEPTNRFLYVANKVDNTISGFSADPNTGALTALPGSPFSVSGSGPAGIVIVPRH